MMIPKRRLLTLIFACLLLSLLLLLLLSLLLLLLLFISHTTGCISGHVSLGHQAISYSLRCLLDRRGGGDKDLFV